VAVWAYGVLEWIDELRLTEITKKTILKTTINRTLICMAGYITALGVLFLYIHIRYGIGEYIEGVSRLFAMTDTATDYKADSMIMGMVNDYRENLYWVIRIAVFAAAGMFVFALFGLLCGILGKKKPADDSNMRTTVADNAYSRINSALQLLDSKEYSRIWYVISAIISMFLGIIMELWLYQRGFCSVDSYTYGPMRRPAILFMMLAMGIAVIRILTPAVEKKEKLISGLVILVILLTSIGSNNKTYPSINNLFIAAPYTMWELWKFVKNAGDIKIEILSLINKKAASPHSESCICLCISSFPAKCVLTVFTMVFVVQSLRFGSGFVFAEATGAQNMTAQTENNDILKGIKMNPERTEWLDGLTEYINAQELEGNDVILYGEIPALSFYLQMPAAFNSWSELPSYAVSVFERDLSATVEKMEKNTAYRPVIILEKEYTDCIDTLVLDGEDFRNADVERIAEIIWNTDADSLTVRQKSAAEKFDILLDFIYDMEYSESYRNEKFAVYR
jgi:hypothetical protein